MVAPLLPTRLSIASRSCRKQSEQYESEVEGRDLVGDIVEYMRHTPQVGNGKYRVQELPLLAVLRALGRKQPRA